MYRVTKTEEFLHTSPAADRLSEAATVRALVIEDEPKVADAFGVACKANRSMSRWLIRLQDALLHVDRERLTSSCSTSCCRTAMAWIS